MKCETRLKARRRPKLGDLLYLLENPYSDLAWYRVFGSAIYRRTCVVIAELREYANRKEVSFLAVG